SSAAGATSKSTPSAASARLPKIIQGEIAARKQSTSTRNRKREAGDDAGPATEGREMSTATSSMMTGGSCCRYDISTTRTLATDEGRLATLRLPYNNFQDEGASTSGVDQLSASAPLLSASAAPSLANMRYQQTQISISPSRVAMG
ncbi:unnamed protein product, partial [Amoebophrya sp. A120]